MPHEQLVLVFECRFWKTSRCNKKGDCVTKEDQGHTIKLKMLKLQNSAQLDRDGCWDKRFANYARGTLGRRRPCISGIETGIFGFTVGGWVLVLGFQCLFRVIRAHLVTYTGSLKILLKKKNFKIFNFFDFFFVILHHFFFLQILSWLLGN